jgi:hypothetical protein
VKRQICDHRNYSRYSIRLLRTGSAVDHHADARYVSRLRKKATTAPEPASVKIITALTLDRQFYRDALRDLLAFYDRVSGHQSAEARKSEGGWTAADVKRLEEIRKLVS